MPSPFPGMNPYLEQDEVWIDFHQRFVPALADAIAIQVRPRYIVKLEEHIYVHELSSQERSLLGRGDVSVVASRPGTVSGTAAAVIEPPARATRARHGY